MVLAACSLGESRREWALAMQGEFEGAIQDQRPLAFAAGCLIAAWREMPAHEHGRFVLANYALALGLLIPTAGLQLACVAGIPYLPLGQGLYGMLTPGSAQQLYLSDAYRAAKPVLLTLWLLLGGGHLRLAWVLLEHDWSRVVNMGALTVAASATLVVFTVVLFLDASAAGLQALMLAIELSAVYASARWHARLFPTAS